MKVIWNRWDPCWYTINSNAENISCFTAKAFEIKSKLWKLTKAFKYFLRKLNTLTLKRIQDVTEWAFSFGKITKIVWCLQCNLFSKDLSQHSIYLKLLHFMECYLCQHCHFFNVFSQTFCDKKNEPNNNSSTEKFKS